MSNFMPSGAPDPASRVESKNTSPLAIDPSGSTIKRIQILRAGSELAT